LNELIVNRILIYPTAEKLYRCDTGGAFISCGLQEKRFRAAALSQTLLLVYLTMRSGIASN